MSTTGRQQDFISEARYDCQVIFAAIHDLLKKQDEWNGEVYGSTLADGTGSNEGILATEVGDAVFALANELELRILDTAFLGNLTALL